MPTLHWIGKDKVINHHMDVPFKVLEHSYGFDNGTQTEQETKSGNKIIHGDNLEALKALLPEYEGRVKCIYIDPPYNTGNEGWVYNDNVNDPKIKKWLGQVVGKESEDLSRHDKWLCMMYPRLKLLHKLLSEDGAIFISIDDNEQANLKLVCDEIFGGGNFIAQIIWEKSDSPRMDAQYYSSKHEYIFQYAKKIDNLLLNKLTYLEDNLPKHFNKKSKDGKPYYLKSLRAMGSGDDTREARPTMYYPIIAPDGTEVFPKKQDGSDGRWRWKKETLEAKIDNIEWVKSKGNWSPYSKIWAENSSRPPETIWYHKDVGSNRTSKTIIKNIFEKSSTFDFPKPTQLIERILEIVSDKNSIVLDSFAGSGTTAHAVFKLNKADGGNRKFICIEMEDYAETITAERVKRVIKGFATTEGTGGSFDFYKLERPMFLEDGNLNELVGVEKIRQYVYYTETKTPLTPTKHKDNKHFLGKHNDTAYYFHCEQDEVTTLDHAFLATMKTKAEQYVIYADNCLLTKDFMTKHHIVFKKIPRDITRF